MKKTVQNKELDKIFSQQSSFYLHKLIESNPKFDFKKPVILFGAAKMGEKMASVLKKYHINLLVYCDNDMAKQGQHIHGKLVVSPQYIVHNFPSTTQIIVSSLYSEEIKAQLKKLCFRNVWSHTYFFTLYPNKFSSSAWTNDIPYLFSQKKKIYQAFNLLEDSSSKKTFVHILQYRLTLNRKYLLNVISPSGSLYFDKDIFKLSKEEILLDGGAYTGDTLTPFIKATNNKFSRVSCFEPDTKSYTTLNKFIKRLKDNRIISIKSGLGKTKGIAYFSDESNLGSKITKFGKSKIKIVPIDDYLDQYFTLVKLDIEGYEKEALLGAKITLKKNRPKLAICSYHHQNDIWDIPLLIKRLNPEYRLYLRHYGHYVFDTVAYGI